MHALDFETDVSGGRSAGLGPRAPVDTPHASTGLDQARHVSCSGKAYEYALSSPDSHAPLAAILLLHGAGGQSSDMMSVWKSLAAREHVVLTPAQQLGRR